MGGEAGREVAGGRSWLGRGAGRGKEGGGGPRYGVPQQPPFPYTTPNSTKLLDISMSVCGRWRATARYGGPWQGSLPGLAVWGTLHLDGGRTVLEPLGRRDNPPDQRTSPGLPGDRPGAQKRKRGLAGFSAGTTRSLKVAGYTPVALATANGTERNRLVRAPTVSRGFLHV